MILETNRLFIREIDFTDENDLFEMDSDPQVHLYIDKKPVISIEQIREAINALQLQYHENSIGRWAVIDKQTKECIGWAGLKLFKEQMNHHQDFHELGYRFKQKHWGKGYASEASKAIIDYAWSHLAINDIYAITDPENIQSQNVLKKLGFKYVETFNYDGEPTDWFELTRPI